MVNNHTQICEVESKTKNILSPNITSKIEETKEVVSEQNNNITKISFANSTKYKSYLFNFNTNIIESVKIGTFIKFSKCALHGLNNTYRKIKCLYNEDEYYVVCPVYVSKKSNKILDTQLSVTGKCQLEENEICATVREIQEELGITTNPLEIQLCSNTIVFDENNKNNCKKKYRKESSFFVDISNSRPYDPKLDMFIRKKDNKQKKIQVVVFGKLNNILEMFEKVINRPDSHDIETIRFLRILSLKEFM